MAGINETEFITIRLRPPTQCALWEHPELALGKDPVFEWVETYDDDSHMTRALRRCRECGQLYFYEWYEWVDWEEGHDQIYRTYIPVQTPDEIAALKQADIVSLLRYYPRLQFDGDKPIWIGKD
jgi:hypothetical protein